MTEVPQPSHDPDLLLVRAVASGSRQALTELYARHGCGILSYLIGQVTDRALAEELLQDVMLAAWKGAADFRAESKVRTWLIGIARMKVLNSWRHQHRRPDAVELHDNLEGEGGGLLGLAQQHETQDAVRAALRRLPDDQRETLELIFYHGLSGVEAADVLGVSAGTVKSRVHRAKNTLRGLLMEVGDDW